MQKLTGVLSFVFVVACGILYTGTSEAAPYGGQQFGQCQYSRDCPSPESPTPSPPPPTDFGDPAPDEDPSPNIVSNDVDNDGDVDEAIDENNDPNDGFEVFRDPNDSATVLKTATDDDDDGGTSFIIDSDGDNNPDIYWDPDDEYVTTVLVEEYENETCWFYQNSNNEQQSECFVNQQTGGQPTTPFTPTRPSPAEGEVEGARRLTGGSFGGEAYQKVGEFVQKIPTPVAYSLPYIFISLVALLAVRLIMQLKRELSRISDLEANINHEQALHEEKQKFLMLSSHYMRTPMTIMKGNIELLESLQAINQQTASSLANTVEGLQAKVGQLLSNLSSSEQLGAIAAPMRSEQAKWKVILSAPVLLPLISLLLISVFLQFTLIDFRVTEPSVFDYIIQGALGLLVAQVFISKYRSYKIYKDNRDHKQQLLKKQRDLDASKGQFVEEASQTLGADIASLDQELNTLQSQGVDVGKIKKGSEQLKSVINKFLFAGKLQAGQVVAAKQQFNGKELAEHVAASQAGQAKEKQVQVVANGEVIQPYSNPELASIVLGSLVDNAIEYAKPGSQVEVTTTTNQDSFVFSVDNEGTPIAQEKIDTLFQPFSRIESAETFDHEGLGFSLYLDRLIMKYLGGDIKITPVPQKGTHAEVQLPVL